MTDNSIRCETHDYCEFGLCHRCGYQSLLHNKKIQRVWIPYD